MGPDWEIDKDNPKKWSGGWPGFRLGLAWWNTHLCWLTRNAAWNCNLEGWDTGLNTLYACIHAPNSPPFSYSDDVITNTTRNQWYFNSDAWQTYVYYDMQVKHIDGLVRDWVIYLAYEKSFSTSNSISWNGKSWRTTPFGACYAVWARVGADPTGQDLNTGWVLSTSQGLAGSASVSLPQGFSTVYFPVIKTMGTFDLATQFSVQWVRYDGAICNQGLMPLSDFQDSGVYSYNGYNQTIYAAMVYPVVCYASTARTVTVRLFRNLSGVGAWLGRPIVLAGACSWFITQ